MLPGSFVERKRACGRPTCHCADGKRLHPQYQISVLVDGKPQAFNIPAKWVDAVREKIEMRQRFEAAAATICSVNLRRFLKEKTPRKEEKAPRKTRSANLSRHRHQFEAYLDKVFGFSDLVSALPEGRQFPQHSWKKGV
jgi:gluconate kinase